jgi:hypothetical protein
MQPFSTTFISLSDIKQCHSLSFSCDSRLAVQDLIWFQVRISSKIVSPLLISSCKTKVNSSLELFSHLLNGRKESIHEDYKESTWQWLASGVLSISTYFYYDFPIVIFFQEGR